MYNLKSSMSDRMDFDSMAHQCGYDSADALELEFLVNIPKSDVEEMAESAFVAGEQFQDDDREEPGYVEDMEEAHARFVGKWVEGFLLRQKENHTEEIKNALVDEGLKEARNNTVDGLGNWEPIRSEAHYHKWESGSKCY